MNKKAMSLITLTISVVIMIIVSGVTMISLSRTNLIERAEQVVDDFNLKNFQQLANIAYSNIYFDNLTQGIRRELTAEEIRARMIKDGAEEIKLNKYEIIVENGNVFVMRKEEK